MTVTRVPAMEPRPEDLGGLDFSADTPVKRTLCLALSDDRNMPLQCRFKLDHVTRHEWEIDNSPLTEGRAERLREEQDTPSGRLPVRTPGAALEEDLSAFEGDGGPREPDEAVRPGASAFPRVPGRWVC